MNLTISIRTSENYREVFSDSVSVEIKNGKEFLCIKEALRSVVDLVKTSKLLSISNDRVVEIMTANLVKTAKAEGAREEKAEHAPSVPVYKLEAKITDLERQLKQKDCQIDGLIMGVNPNHAPNPDGLEPQNL